MNVYMKMVTVRLALTGMDKNASSVSPQAPMIPTTDNVFALN